MGSKRAQKGSVNSVSSVRDKTPHELNCALKRSVKSVCSVREKTSTKYASSPKGVTSHTNNQQAPPPTPPPKGRGVITEIPL